MLWVDLSSLKNNRNAKAHNIVKTHGTRKTPVQFVTPSDVKYV